MAAKRLRLEVTETSLATDSGQVLATLRALKRMDISMVIDDFGTGYSSLSYLQRLPFNTLKIDRSFTRELGAGDGSPEIVRTIIQLARTLKLKVVAEGVETADQVTRLTALGCDLLQGFYFGKPADVEHTEAMIRDRDALHPVFPYGEEGEIPHGRREFQQSRTASMVGGSIQLIGSRGLRRRLHLRALGRRPGAHLGCVSTPSRSVHPGSTWLP